MKHVAHVFIAVFVFFSLFGNLNPAKAQTYCIPGDLPYDILPVDKTAPDFVSGTVVLWSCYARGSGFIFEYNGGYFLGSVHHVLYSMRWDEENPRNPESIIFAWVPNTELLFVLDLNSISFADTRTRDPFGWYSPTSAEQTQIAQAIRDGEVLAYTLQYSTRNVSAVEIPDIVTEQWLQYQLTVTSDESLRIETDGTNGVICKGNSGGPVVKRGTYIVVGVLSYITDRNSLSNNGRSCALEVYAERIPNWP
ncbi:MAG: trypsin-like serine protease [Candidatus Dojkabacteria bacterium]|nr:MAG: trypsin-like serine protease [Candidatus Dojkabacteria bacterium]